MSLDLHREFAGRVGFFRAPYGLPSNGRPLGGVLLAGALMLLVGCGGDLNEVGRPGGDGGDGDSATGMQMSDAGDAPLADDAGTTAQPDAASSDAATADDEDGGDSSPDAGSPLAGAFAEGVIDALCSYGTRCALGELGVIADNETCRALLSRRGADTDFVNWFAIAREEAAGALDLDAAEASTCLAEIEAAQCQPELGVGVISGLASCRAATQGTRAVGEACVANEACASGLCQRGSGCAGTCIAAKTEGMPCDGDCGPGLFCAPKFDATKVCQAFGQLGDGCNNRPCVASLVCSRNPDTQANECTTPPATLGSDCSATRACGGGLRCVDTRPAPLCESFPSDGQPCFMGECAARHLCDYGTLTPTCRALGDGSEGGVCESQAHCGAGLTCERGNFYGYCQPTIAAGQACEAHPSRCAPGLACQGNQGSRTCQALPTTGNCVDGRCAHSSTCHFGTCIPLPGAGEACLDSSSVVCAPGTACSYATQPGICAALRTEGQLCTDYQCADGLVCTGPLESAVCSVPAQVVLPSPGEACVNGQCAVGARCEIAAITPTSIVCMATGSLGEACPGGRCLPGLSCSEGTCQLQSPVSACTTSP